MPIKTTVITGATSGIGKATALALAKKGHAVYMLVRNVEKGEQVRSEILAHGKNLEVYVIACNLASLASVTAAAAILKDKLFGINVLINNAGGIFAGRELSADGFEMTFVVNHLAHFVLTESLMPLLERGQARIINLSSEAHKIGKPVFNDLQSQQQYSAMKAYGMAKLFNIYFTKLLAEKYKSKGITAFAVHPGLVKTSFGVGLNGLEKLLMWLAKPLMITAEKGAQTSVYLATQPKLDAKTGLYFKNCKVARPAAVANNEAARNQLWVISSQLSKAFLQ